MSENVSKELSLSGFIPYSTCPFKTFSNMHTELQGFRFVGASNFANVLL